MAAKVLVIDEDKKFAQQLVNEGKRQGADVDWSPGFAEVGWDRQLGAYDCVIAGLPDDPVKAIDIGRAAAAFFFDLPVLLVDEDRSPRQHLTLKAPAKEREAQIAKGCGARAVMASALTMARGARSGLHCPAMPRSRAKEYHLSA